MSALHETAKLVDVLSRHIDKRVEQRTEPHKSDFADVVDTDPLLLQIRGNNVVLLGDHFYWSTYWDGGGWSHVVSPDNLALGDRVAVVKTEGEYSVVGRLGLSTTADSDAAFPIDTTTELGGDLSGTLPDNVTVTSVNGASLSPGQFSYASYSQTSSTTATATGQLTPTQTITVANDGATVRVRCSTSGFIAGSTGGGTVVFYVQLDGEGSGVWVNRPICNYFFNDTLDHRTMSGGRDLTLSKGEHTLAVWVGNSATGAFTQDGNDTMWFEAVELL